MGVIQQVDPKTVVIHHPPSARDVTRQKDRLLTEGQIEPVLLGRDGSPSHGPHGWVYAEALVVAAIQLDWPTILVTNQP